MTTTAPVAGVDRWRGGWVMAIVESDRLVSAEAGDITAARSALDQCQVVAVDIPIALVEHGRRTAESAIRAVLGRAARSVFTSPTRAAVDAETQAEATERNRAAGGPGVSAQAFGLFASIREVRSSLTEHPDPSWWETHPETSFTVMNHGTPLASKRSALGAAQRLHLLRAHFPSLDTDLLSVPERVPIDDVLDAGCGCMVGSQDRPGRRRDLRARRAGRPGLLPRDLRLMAVSSSGMCLWRRTPHGIEVLLAHPGGPFWAKKDDGAWSLPKGEFDPATEDGLDAARGEFAEELGHPAPAGCELELGETRLKSGKRVVAWAVEGDLDPSTIRSNTFEIEWPPRSGRRATFPEVDRAGWFDLRTARRKLNPAQAVFIDRLAARLDTPA